MTAPVTAPGEDQSEAARQAARARWRKRQARQAVRQAEQDEERRLRRMRRAARAEDRRMRREDRADRAIGASGAAQGWVRRAAPGIAAAVPVALVNGTAFIGQFAYVKDHVPWILPGQVLVAATFESVAVYLAWHAHLAMMKNDSSTRLKMGAQTFALIMGAMNYSHYASQWHPTVMAVGMGLMSLLSPSLWGVYSRRAARDKLMERGLVEEHAVRLGANRWTWHPVRSVEVMWRATWLGENNPQRAIALYENAHQARHTAAEERRAARAIEKGAPEEARQPRQGEPEGGAPAARQAVPPAGAPEIPAAPRQETVPAGGAPEWMQSYAGPVLPVPGTALNGKPADVKAIAALAAEPTMKAQHEIDPQRIEEVELHLAGLPAGSLPAERAVSDMLCPGSGHNHRRKAAELIRARKAAGPDPLPAFTRRQRPANAATAIATPVSNLPGGKQANG